MTRLLGLALAAAGATWLVHLGDVNVLHWKVMATGVVACMAIAYGAMCAITNRWGP